MRALTLGLLAGLVALGGCSKAREAGSGGGAADSGGGGGVSGSTGGSSGSNGNSGAGGGSGAGASSGSGGGNTGPVPMFPGAGTSTNAGPLPGGMVCDSVPGATLATVGNVTRCLFGPNNRTNPAATIEQVLECVDGATVLHLRLTFAPWFNDNTYGSESIGWSPVRGHRFPDLTGSDHAELVLIDGNGDVAMQFKMDYISRDDSAPSGYASLGVSGGDGSVEIGDEAHILDVSTSLDENLNDRGYSSYVVDSPATDEDFTPNPATPEWDYRVVFDVWIDLDAFGDAGFAGAFIDYVHASPSKSDDDTIETTPDECPPEWDPCLDGNPDTYCNEPPVGCYDGDPITPCDDPCGDDMPDTYCDVGTPPEGCYDGDPGTPCDDPCGDDMPDTYCGGGEPPGSDPPAYCERYPTDPACRPD